jgi:hypothetical protein
LRHTFVPAVIFIFRSSWFYAAAAFSSAYLRCALQTLFAKNTIMNQPHTIRHILSTARFAAVLVQAPWLQLLWAKSVRRV